MAASLPKESDHISLDALWESCLASLVPPDGDLTTTAQAWSKATDYLQPRRLEETNTLSNPPQDVVNAVSMLHELGMIQDLLDWHSEQTNLALKQILPQEVEEYQEDIPVLLVRLAKYLQAWMKPQQALIDGIPSTSSSSPSSILIAFRQMFTGHVSQLLIDQRLVDDLRKFFVDTTAISKVSEDDTAAYVQTLQALHYLGLFERFEPVLFDVVYAKIDDKLESSCVGDFTTEGLLESLTEWLVNEVGNWLVGIYMMAFHHLDEDAARAKAVKALKPAMQRFEWHVATEMFKLRLNELFDIVVDYPDSVPAIQDLAICLAKTEQKGRLVQSLIRQMRKRLLHPGADTRDILTTYINLIRVLRILDPPGVILSKVAQPVRAYLRSRQDTIRCIVQGMVEEDGDLMNELRGGSVAENDEVREIKEKTEEEVEDYTDEGYKWVPAPIDAPADYTRNKTADIIQLLVSIYDTKELFVKELQVLLAEKLLSIKNYAFEKELRNVEILKMRFGEAALAGLEVMLKDCADSKRTDNSLHAPGNPSTINAPVHSLVVSHLFWPRFKKQYLKLPGQLGRLAKQYEKSFTKLKPEKLLDWFPALGSVSLEIVLKDRTLELDVTPLQAAVLEMFDVRPTHKMQDIRQTLRVRDVNQIKSALQYWQSKGVIAQVYHPTSEGEQTEPTWTLLETNPTQVDSDAVLASTTPNHNDRTPAPAPTELHLKTAIDPQAAFEAIQPFWGFVQNALANLHSLPSPRLHRMMTSLAPGYPGRTLEELEAFLEVARSEGQLVKGKDGFWRLAAL